MEVFKKSVQNTRQHCYSVKNPKSPYYSGANCVGLRVVVKENSLLSSVNLDLVELKSVFES